MGTERHGLVLWTLVVTSVLVVLRDSDQVRVSSGFGLHHLISIPTPGAKVIAFGSVMSIATFDQTPSATSLGIRVAARASSYGITFSQSELPNSDVLALTNVLLCFIRGYAHHTCLPTSVQ